MAKKNVVLYWNKLKVSEGKFLEFLRSERLDYFDEISKGANLALILNANNYLGSLKFKNYYQYKNQSFYYKKGPIFADVILDRTLGLDFPRSGKKMNEKVINCYDFKRIIRNKYNFSKYFKEYSPVTHLCRDDEHLKKLLKKYHDNELLVAKPLLGRRGEDIFVLDKNSMLKIKLNYPILIQEFVETYGNFLDKNKRHDIRLVIINGKIVHTFVRFPSENQFVANVSRGGEYKEIVKKDLPKKVLKRIEPLALKIKEEFYNPFYSIDIGISNNNIYIFEMNNKIGFPDLNKQGHRKFKTELASLILDKAKN